LPEIHSFNKTIYKGLQYEVHALFLTNEQQCFRALLLRRIISITIS
jgi:hypothetical protein